MQDVKMEREAVVAYIRSMAGAAANTLYFMHMARTLTSEQTAEEERIIATYTNLADDIERGDHLKGNTNDQ